MRRTKLQAPCLKLLKTSFSCISQDSDELVEFEKDDSLWVTTNTNLIGQRANILLM